MTSNYPEGIYITPVHKTRVEDSLAITSDSVIKMVERAYDLGKTNAAKDTTDWHDLTAAIKAGEPIDWEKLDGRRAKCEHVSGPQFIYKFQTDLDYEENTSDGHVLWSDHQSWVMIFDNAWKGRDGWTLYIDGPVPMKRKTADQLKPGTCFKGGFTTLGEREAVIIEKSNGDVKAFVVGGRSSPSVFARHVEVIEEYGIGTFKAGDDE